jgi:hypothetical protein
MRNAEWALRSDDYTGDHNRAEWLDMTVASCGKASSAEALRLTVIRYPLCSMAAGYWLSVNPYLAKLSRLRRGYGMPGKSEEKLRAARFHSLEVGKRAMVRHGSVSHCDRH